MRTVLKGNIIHAPALGQLSVTPGGYLLLEDGAIVHICPTLPDSWKGCPLEDYGDCLILQSFADMHLHAPQYPQLGLGMDLPLLAWLDTYTFPLEAAFADEDFARRAYRALARELIALGTTRICMFSSVHRRATQILMEELEAAGVTGCVGKVNMDRNCPDSLRETAEGSLAETVRWLDQCNYPHIKPILTPRFTPSCSDELMAGLGRLAAERGLGVQSHLSENLDEMAWVRELCPDCGHYWESYAKFGLWEGSVMAHCVHCDDRERAALREGRVLAVHCADSNTNLCSGVAPVRQLLEEGVQVALGSDMAGGGQLSMWDVAAMSIRVSKQRTIHDPERPAFLTAAEAYYLGTSAGHRYFGAGPGFALGDRLHAVVVDDRGFPPTPRELTLPERLERALYLTRKEHIRAVYSEGRRVLAAPL